MDCLVQGETAGICVPSEDGSIAHALTELDAKVAAWVDAMRAAEASLAEMSAGSRRRTKTTDRSKKDRTVPDDGDSKPCMDTTVVAVDSDDVAVEPTPSGNGPASAMEPTEPETSEGVQPAQDPVEAATVEQVTEEVVGEFETAPDPSRDASEDEDAELLATLDPETAKAIRVMRRLAPVKKSVRELLSEYEANKAHEQVEQPQKKSWFQRRR